MRPVGIGEVYQRLMAKCVILHCGHQATTACGNLILCAGLPAGIDGTIHAVMAVVISANADEMTPPELLTQAEPPIAPPAPANQDFMSDEETDLEDAENIPVTLLVVARNGFNELGRKTMLWTVCHTWDAGARFAFNCYRHLAQLIVRQAGGPCSIILAEKSVIQGDPLAMILYSLAMAPLVTELRAAISEVLQP